MTSAGVGPLDCLAVASTLTYQATAVPQSVGSSGTRSFAINQIGTVWENVTGAIIAAITAAPSANIRPLQ